MRQKISTAFALTIGVITVAVCVVFALTQSGVW